MATQHRPCDPDDDDPTATSEIALDEYGSGEEECLQRWSFVDGIYFAMVTISTVGYGDLYPDEQSGGMLLFTVSAARLFFFRRAATSWRCPT